MAINKIKLNKIFLGRSRERGAVLLDAMVSIIVISVAFSVILYIGTSSIKISTLLKQTTEANTMLKESIEAVRNFRDGTDWSDNGLGSLLTGASNPYHIFLNTTVSPSQWDLVAGTEADSIFTKQIIFDRVSRNPSTHDIEYTYNSLNDDAETRKVTAIVSWQGHTLQLITYFTNWR